MGRLDGRLHADGVSGVDQQDVDALLQHVFDITDLLGHVVAGVSDDQLGTDGRAGFFQGVFHGDEIGVVDFLERGADADGLGGVGKRGGRAAQGDAGSQ